MQAQRDDGKQVVAIPRNFNESKGLNFAEASLRGVPIGKAYAERRSSTEPLIDMTQTKGDSEAAPNFGPTTSSRISRAPSPSSRSAAAAS